MNAPRTPVRLRPSAHLPSRREPAEPVPRLTVAQQQRLWWAVWEELLSLERPAEPAAPTADEAALPAAPPGPTSSDVGNEKAARDPQSPAAPTTKE